MSNKKVKYESHFQQAYLSEPEYGKWLKKDNDNILTFCTVCLKNHSQFQLMEKKALVLHASSEFHKSRLCTSGQTTVKFVKDKLKEKKTFQKMKILLIP